MAHSWFDGHAPTKCVHGSRALSSGCVVAAVKSASDIPLIHNSRPIMVRNDSHAFDLLVLAPVVHGWVLLGEEGKYVRVSKARFDSVSFSSTGIRASLSGTEGESTSVTALQPLAGGSDWLVQVKSATFGKGGRATLAFGGR